MNKKTTPSKTPESDSIWDSTTLDLSSNDNIDLDRKTDSFNPAKTKIIHITPKITPIN